MGILLFNSGFVALSSGPAFQIQFTNLYLNARALKIIYELKLKSPAAQQLSGMPYMQPGQRIYGFACATYKLFGSSQLPKKM